MVKNIFFSAAKQNSEISVYVNIAFITGLKDNLNIYMRRFLFLVFLLFLSFFFCFLITYVKSRFLYFLSLLSIPCTFLFIKGVVYNRAIKGFNCPFCQKGFPSAFLACLYSNEKWCPKFRIHFDCY